MWLSVLFLSLSSCIEDCTKKFLLTGKVVDQSNIPVADVKIRWYYSNPTTPENVLGYTDGSGNYSAMITNFGGLSGVVLEFVKPGYANQLSAPYSVPEAGSRQCGNITLTRNATLTP